ncbi:V-type ATP synthase subunit E [Coriobacteriia bacterium Es71-Z0120]|uniref:V-type ATP synthase subunit E n=1 Tax=Parvivirga hydrogeniphila TaxID=2939460 RepID=UPI002260CFFD|nr:V-type ATP synthase subunit E [Parvivirga hydrogeniphila]MCL4078580.1 V-type ATP synthase subunit E [Parvivirga hydrogeniphila]
MAIEDIFRALEEQADSECRDILNAADIQAASIVEEARAEAERIKQRKLEAVEEALRARAGKIVNDARLDAKRALAQVREQLVNQVFDAAAARLASMRGDSAYERVFRGLAEEALAGADGSCVVTVAPADVALARKVLADFGVSGEVEADDAITGGLVVSLHGGRVVRRNTFDSRLQKVRTAAEAAVAEILTR